jgi:hypothetical protein
MRRHTIDVTEKELRDILTAFDLARDDTVNPKWRYWHQTKRVNDLYLRLRSHGL